MSRFDFIATALAGLVVVQRKMVEDERGFLSRFYCAEEFGAEGFGKSIVQINHAFTRNKGAVRGLHFQYAPHAETKLVSCLKGEILDIAVDLRRGSPTFLQWHGEVLSDKNRKSLLLTEGYAHGFQALTDNCELIYLHTAAYHPELEGALNVSDPILDIIWPLQFSDLSSRDQNHPFVNQTFQGIVV